MNVNSKHTGDLVVVYSAANEIEAKLVVDALSNVGIQAAMQGQHIASFRAEVPLDVKVVVREADVTAAKTEIEKLDLAAGADHVDWEQVDVGEPEA